MINQSKPNETQPLLSKKNSFKQKDTTTTDKDAVFDFVFNFFLSSYLLRFLIRGGRDQLNSYQKVKKTKAKKKNNNKHKDSLSHGEQKKN